MPFQLSPDREYYWDGTRWVRAISPDGRWRWDGVAWRPAGNPARSNARAAAVIGVVAVAVLLVAGIGAFAVTRMLPLERSGLAGFGLVCRGSSDSAGTPLASGDSVCGYRLGSAELTASCAGDQVPAGTRAWQKGPSDAQATSYDMVVDDQGCDLDAQPRTVIWLQSQNAEPPDVIVVADYVPHSDWGSIGVELGCNGATCVDFFIDPAGVYRLDEERGPGDWHIIARGALPVFTISHLDQLNRLVVRYRDRSVQAFLNGYAVVRATTSLLETAGFASIYSDDVIGTEAALVHVRTLDVFGST